MPTTISTSGTVGVNLTAASQNPVTVTGTGTIDTGGTYASAIYGYYGVPGTITNSGLLEAPNGYGIFTQVRRHDHQRQHGRDRREDYRRRGRSEAGSARSRHRR